MRYSTQGRRRQPHVDETHQCRKQHKIKSSVSRDTAQESSSLVEICRDRKLARRDQIGHVLERNSTPLQLAPEETTPFTGGGASIDKVVKSYPQLQAASHCNLKDAGKTTSKLLLNK